MNAEQFFWLVASMRDAQREYFDTRDSHTLRRCIAIERDVDDEIYRVKNILGKKI